MGWIIRIESLSLGASELSSLFGEPDVIVSNDIPSLLVYEPPQDWEDLATEWQAITASLCRIESSRQGHRCADTHITLHLRTYESEMQRPLDIPSDLIAALGRVQGKLEIFCCA